MIHLALHKLAHINTARSTAFVLWTLLACAFGVYMYCIVLSVMNITLRQDLAIQIQNTEAYISDLEAQYLARTNTLTQSHLADAGLVPIHEVSYVSVEHEDRISRLP